jgi:PAS domain S-box-containing protein
MLVTDARAPDNPIVWVNDAFLSQTGYSLDEVKGRNCRFLQGTETDPGQVALIRQAVASGQSVSVELLNYRKNGSTFWNALTLTPIHDDHGLAYFFGAQTDTTGIHHAQTGAQDALLDLQRQLAERTAALEEKTALLQEVDHRVKNTLQVISSLMLLKARRSAEGEARDALEGMAERIGALSIAHRLLYSENDVTQFNLVDFVAELLSDLDAGMADDRVKIGTEVEPIPLPASMAAPLALMIHELTANALRHGFPGGRGGSVIITARRTTPGMHLEVADDGIGLSASPPNEAGFGRSLVEMVTRQLRGTVRWLEGTPGTKVEIDVPLRPAT